MSPGPGRREGFTLIELIIALVLSSFILAALIGVVSQMMRGEMETSAKAAASGWSSMSLNALQKELADSTVLYCPFPDASHPGCPGSQSKVLSICGNYTLNPFTGAGPSGGPLDGDLGKVRSAYYCLWEGGTPTKTPWLLRYTGTTCPISPTPVCGAGSYQVVANDIYPFDPAADFIFRRADDIAGVQVSFTIGRSTATADQPNPAYTKVDTRLHMQKALSNPYD